MVPGAESNYRKKYIYYNIILSRLRANVPFNVPSNQSQRIGFLEQRAFTNVGAC